MVSIDGNADLIESGLNILELREINNQFIKIKEEYKENLRKLLKMNDEIKIEFELEYLQEIQDLVDQHNEKYSDVSI